MACWQTMRERRQIMNNLPRVLRPAEHTPANLQLMIDLALAGRVRPADQESLAARVRASGMLIDER